MFTFSNPLLFWAFPILALPWLLRRRQDERIQHIEFPLIRFLRESEEKERVNPYLQELLLLILRTLLLALLLLALAGPKWQTADGSQGWMPSWFPFGQSFQSHILAVDSSYSMGYEEEQNNWWRKSQQAWEIIEQNIQGLSLHRVQWDAQTTSPDQANLPLILNRVEMENLFLDKPTHDGTTITTLLETLEARFDDRKSLILVTDGQAYPWQPLLQSTSEDSLPFSILAVCVGEGPATNRWVDVNTLSSLPWGIAGWETLAGRVLSHGENETDGRITVTRQDSGDPLYDRAILFPAAKGTPAGVPFTCPVRFADLFPETSAASRPERLTFDIQIMPPDPLSVDNEISLDIPYIEQFSVGIFGDEDTHYQSLTILKTIFNPSDIQTQSPYSIINTILPPVREISDETDMFIVARHLVPWWSPQETTAAMNFIKKGGTAVVFTHEPGPKAEPWEQFLSQLGWQWDGDNPNTDIQGISVAKTDLLSNALADWKESMWEGWIQPYHGTAVHENAKPIVTYRLGDQTHHLLSEIQLGQGKVWLLNTSITVDGETILSPILPAFLWEAGKETARMNQSYTISLPQPKQESDLRLLTEEEKQRLSDQFQIQFTRIDNLAADIDKTYGGTDLRLILLFVCVLVALVESWLSNRLASV